MNTPETTTEQIDEKMTQQKTEAVAEPVSPQKTKSKKGMLIGVAAALCLVLVGGAATGFFLLRPKKDSTPASAPSTTESPVEKEDPAKWETGLIASLHPQVEYYDENGNALGTLARGTQVHYKTEGESTAVFANEAVGTLPDGASIVSETSAVVPKHTLYVRTAVNLRDENGKLLDTFAVKGEGVSILGCDFTKEDGSVHMYRVRYGEAEGYIMPHYLVDTAESAAANFDNGSYATHAGRPNRYGGGDAGSLDYYPREKGPIEGNVMPAECRTLYVAAWRVAEIDTYLALASGSGINAFVVDITDGGAIGYASPAMTAHCPSAAAAACNTVENYRAAIQKIKDAGYYVIGRITTFNDTYFIKDHPEYAIADTSGNPLRLAGANWPTPYSRAAWQYKVDLAVDAVKTMGFQEIQFDYVRFPDNTARYEKAGTVNFRNQYGETKAQAIQRFLMYATDILHEQGVYVGADVYGESAYTYVTAYGQYWPAISNVVDVISGMPYPDHFAANGTWLPWEHPYETLLNWGKNAMLRQGETATPAVIRTWIQSYNAIRKPYNTYGPEEIAAQIRGLRDAGCTGGYMTWNAASSPEKYTKLLPAFTPNV